MDHKRYDPVTDKRMQDRAERLKVPPACRTCDGLGIVVIYTTGREIRCKDCNPSSRAKGRAPVQK